MLRRSLRKKSGKDRKRRIEAAGAQNLQLVCGGTVFAGMMQGEGA